MTAWARGGLVAAGGVMMAIYLGVALSLPFLNHDPLIYVLIGRAMWRHGILPYGAIFDHKPIGLYAIYGLADLAFGWVRTGFFTMFALLSWALSAGLAARALRPALAWRAGLAILGFALLAGARFAVLTGNAEAAYEPLCLATLLLLLGDAGGWWRPFLAGICAMAAVQTNYLAAVALALPVLAAVLSGGGAAIGRRLSAGIAGALVVVGAIIVAYRVAGVDIRADYLALQAAYLRHYGGNARDRLEALRLFAGCSLAFAPFLWVVWRAIGRERPVRIVLWWWGASVLACCASGHAFAHYYAMALGPLAVLFGLAWRRADIPGLDRRLGVALVPVMVMSGLWIVHDTTHAWKMRAALAATDYARAGRIAGMAPVLSMDGSHVPYFMAGLVPATRFIFPGHVPTVLGAGADAFMQGALDRAPAFVITAQRGCPASRWPRACARLTATYRPVLDQPDRYDFGFVLWRLDEGARPRAQPGAIPMH